MENETPIIFLLLFSPSNNQAGENKSIDKDKFRPELQLDPFGKRAGLGSPSRQKQL